MKNFNRKNSETNKQNGRKGIKGLLALALAVVMMVASVLPAFAGSIYDIFDPGSGGSIKDSTEITETVEDNGSQGGSQSGSQGSQTGGGVYDSTGGGYYESTEDYYSEDTVWNGDYYEEVEVIPSTEQGDFEEVVEVIEEPTEVVDDTAVVEEELIEDTQDTAQLPVVTLSDAREDRGKNVISLAQAYLGWGEHYSDYKEYADGTVVGATIFGETFGDAYMPWNVSFVSYILQLAGIDDLPLAKNMSELAAALKGSDYAGRVVKADSYTPVEGDLVLLGLPGKTIAEINPATTIEKLAELDASAYSAAGAGVAAGLVNASAVASANQQDDRAEAVYTRVGIVKSIGQKQEKDAAGHTVTRNILTVIEGDVEDPAVAGVTDIEAQYRMTGSVEEVEYDLDAMTLTYDDIAGLSAEELNELAKTDAQVLDYIILTKENVAEPTPTPTPEPTPVPEKIEDVSADAIDQNSIGAGAMLGLMVKPKAELVASEAAHAALETADLTSLRLIIGAEDGSIFANDTRVVAGYNGIYLLQAETEEEARAAFLAYYDKVDFIAPDVAVAIADGETDEDPAEEVIATENVYTEEENPFVELETALEETPAAPKRNVRRIALIDTGASVSSNNNKGVIEAVSMIGEDGADDNGHGERMVAFILSENPDAEILSIKALGADGKGDVSAVIAGIQYALENRASIINLSVSAYATEENAALADAIRKATEAGATVVGAAGNNGFNAKYYTPANIAEATIIGACDENGNRIAASNFGETVDYYMVAEATSEAAAKFSGFISANGESAVADALGNGAIFAAEYEAPVETPAETTEETPVETPTETDGTITTASKIGYSADQQDASEHLRSELNRQKYTRSDGVHVLTWDAMKSTIESTKSGTTLTIKLGSTEDAGFGGIAAYTPITIPAGVTVNIEKDTEDTIYTDKTTSDLGPFFIVGANATLNLGEGVKLTGEVAESKAAASLVEYPEAAGGMITMESNGKLYSTYLDSTTHQQVTKELSEVLGIEGSLTAKVPGSTDWEGRGGTVGAREDGYFNVVRDYKDGENNNHMSGEGGFSWRQTNWDNQKSLVHVLWTIVTNEDGTSYLKNKNGYVVTPDGHKGWASNMTAYLSGSTGTQNTNAGSAAVNKSTFSVTPTTSGEKYQQAKDDRAFFVEVNGGTLNLNGATLTNANGGKAPISVTGANGKVIMNSGTIGNNSAVMPAKHPNGNDPVYSNTNIANRDVDNKNPTKEGSWGLQTNTYTEENADGQRVAKTNGSAGAISVSGGGKVEIKGGTISGNTGDAGAIYVNGGTVTQSGGSLSGNHGFNAGAVVSHGTSSTYNMENGTMSGNDSVWYSGAVSALDDGAFKLGSKDSANIPAITGNKTLDCGGAVYVRSDNVTLDSGLIENNQASVYGGGVYVVGGDQSAGAKNYVLKLDETYVHDNTVNKNTTDNAYKGYNTEGGGGLWTCSWGSLVLDTELVHIYNNTARTNNGTDIRKETGHGILVEFDTDPGDEWHEQKGGTEQSEEYGPYEKVLRGGELVANPAFMPIQGAIALINKDGSGWSDKGTDENDKTGVLIVRENSAGAAGGGIALNGLVAFADNNIDRDVFRADFSFTKGWEKDDEKQYAIEHGGIDFRLTVTDLTKDPEEVLYQTVFNLNEGVNVNDVFGTNGGLKLKDWTATVGLPQIVVDGQSAFESIGERPTGTGDNITSAEFPVSGAFDADGKFSIDDQWAIKLEEVSVTRDSNGNITSCEVLNNYDIEFAGMTGTRQYQKGAMRDKQGSVIISFDTLHLRTSLTNKTKTGKFRIVKMTENNTNEGGTELVELKGATFTIYEAASSTTTLAEAKAAAEADEKKKHQIVGTDIAVFEFNNLKDNTYYYVEETTPPTGYEKVEPFMIHVSVNNGDATIRFEGEHDSNVTLRELGEDQVFTFQAIDEQTIPGFSLEKYEENGTTALAGARFQVTSFDGKWTTEMTADSAGTSFRIEELRDIKTAYYIEEIQTPKGKEPLGTVIPIYVTKENGINVVRLMPQDDPRLSGISNTKTVDWTRINALVVAGTDANNDLLLKVKNKVRVPELEIKKVDEKGRPLAGAEFKINSLDGEWFAENSADRVLSKSENGDTHYWKKSELNQAIRVRETDADPWGTIYILEETTAPAGYDPLGTAIPLRLDRENMTYVLVTEEYAEENFTEEQKKNLAKKVNWEVLNPEDENQKKVTQTSDTTTGKFTITAVNNKHVPELEVLKTDNSVTAKELPGAKFRLRTADNGWSRELTVDATNGARHTMKGYRTTDTSVDKSIYLLEEIETPDGYAPLGTAIPLRIDPVTNRYRIITETVADSDPEKTKREAEIARINETGLVDWAKLKELVTHSYLGDSAAEAAGTTQLQIKVKNAATFRVEKKWVGGNQSGVTLKVNVLRKKKNASGNWENDSSFSIPVDLDQSNDWKKELFNLAPGYIYYAEEVSYTDATGETTRVNGERIGDYAILYEGNTSASDAESTGSGSSGGDGTGNTGSTGTVTGTAVDYTLSSQNQNNVLLALKEGDNNYLLYTEGTTVKVKNLTDAQINTLVSSGSYDGVNLTSALFDVEKDVYSSSCFYLKQDGKYLRTAATSTYDYDTVYTLSAQKPSTNTFSRFEITRGKLYGSKDGYNTRGFDIGGNEELLSTWSNNGPAVLAKKVTLSETNTEPGTGSEPTTPEEPVEEVPGEQSTKITNTFIDKTKVKVKKEWQDNNNADKKRPPEIRVTLFSDETEENSFRNTGLDAVTLDATNNWEYTYEDLPKKTEGGRTINYRIIEAVPSGYSVSYATTEESTDCTLITVTNTKNDSTGVKVKVEKEWKNAAGTLLSANDPDIPESIRVQLWSSYESADDTMSPHKKDGKTVELDLTKEGNWKGEWTGLPKYKANGQLVKYEVRELEGGSRWTVTYDVTEVQVNESTSSTSSYYGYKETNGTASQNGSKIALGKYYVKKNETGSSQEIAYCMHYNREDPNDRSYDYYGGSSTTWYDRVEVTNTNPISNYYGSSYGSNSTRPYFGTAPNDELKKRLMKIIYFGYGHDAKGLQKSKRLTDEEFIYLTQFAVWEFTDFYGPYKGRNGYSSTNTVYNRTWYLDKANHPYGLEAKDFYDSSRGWMYQSELRVPSDLEEEYKELLGYVMDPNTDNVINGLRLFIYAPTDGTRYQSLLGVETIETETHAKITNKRVEVDLGIYKYEEKDGKKTPIANVAFDLYEASKASNAKVVDVGGGETVQAIHLGQFKTGDTGYFSFEKNGKKILVPGKTYYLKETVPAGYFALKHAISFTVDDKGGKPVVNWTDLSSETVHFKPTPATAELLDDHSDKASENWIGVLEIKNTELYELPSTGGIGTYWSTILGTAFLALAAMFVYNMIIGRRRRRR